MNGRFKPPEQGSGQKNKEIRHNFLLEMYFWASGGKPLPPGYA